MRHSFLHRIEKFLAEECRITAPKRLLVGLSGGADSMALLDALRCLGYDCLPVHFNFGLRGEESRRDEDFVRQFCQSQELKLIVEHLPARAYAEANHLSIEMAARELRYRRFEELRLREQADYLAVGHHSDDDLETFFLNLLRGSGPKGLCGIRPLQGNILRPLLCVSHEEILHYLEYRGISHITDSSNLSTEFRRNRLRLELLPLLESIEPAARKNIGRSIHLLKESEQLYETLIEEEYARWTDKTQADIARLEASPVAKGLFHKWLSDFGFSSATVFQIWENRHGQSGQVYGSATHRLLLNRQVWRLEPKCDESQKEVAASEVILIQKDDRCVESPLLENMRFEARITEVPQGQNPMDFLSRQSDELRIDASRLIFPLRLRLARPGDRFRPFGMQGSRLLSDFLTDLKCTRFEKERCLVLCNGDGEIIWVVGRRPSQTFAIHAGSRCLYQVSITPK